MRMAMIGLGKMGGNMTKRLCRGGVEVVGYNRSQAVVAALAKSEGMIAAESLDDVVAKLSAPRSIWLMLPAGEPTEQTLTALLPLLERGDVIIDGGNANYHDTQRRSVWLAQQGVSLADAGTSGGVWGLDNGYCLMVGGATEAIDLIKPALQVLAPAPDRGWAHVGPVGAGHFTKMVHNGIEYGMMQAMAEGFSLLHSKQDLSLDLAQIAELWRHGSVVRSWLLDLTADALAGDQQLHDVAPFVPDSGEGRWTVQEAVDQGVALPVISMALAMRFASQDEQAYGNRMLSVMRNAFGGHLVKKFT